MKMIRLLIATPSKLDQSRLARALAQCNQIEIIDTAETLRDTYAKCERLEPDIILLADAWTRHTEFQGLKDLCYAVNSLWIELRSPGRDTQAGLALTGRPTARTELPGSPTKDISLMSGSSPEEIMAAIRIVMTFRGPRPPRPPRPITGQSMARTGRKTILIGASTGGVDALLTILSSFPADCPPTAIVQHTGSGSSESLARLIGRRCAAEVQVATTGLIMRPGLVCIAGGTPGHLKLSESGGNLRATIERSEPVSGHMPSVDAMFLSAVPFARRVVAALLTGMGRDGANGLLALRNAGASTIGQDEQSSVVYGMPRAAAEIGAVQRQLALQDIGPYLMQICASENAGAA